MSTGRKCGKGGRIHFPKWLQIPGYLHLVVAVQGRWPDQLEVIATSTDGRVGIAEHWTVSRKAWSTRRADHGGTFSGVVSVGNSLVGMEVPTILGRGKIATLRGPQVPLTLATGPADAQCRFWDPGMRERHDEVMRRWCGC
ncbi:hypothetical protein [Chondromyces apiculatus]|uniref:Uncharacterized protein n=1 Tax=Chondromyces apiculatus DSM 436 TaxID=1192034 RepID=A0A017TGN2_9BACT|nr:hypothetical protein [Chondromyces apiculatus]EYF07771.1 Hypothetical protein CAP_7720 [Chondromyces apiculatus DSM 436]